MSPKDQFFGFYIFVVIIFWTVFKSADSQNANTELSGTHNTITNDSSEKTNLRCQEGFYLARELCYRFPKKPYQLVNHPRACDHLANTTYANRMCVCLENYYLDDNHCYKIPLDPNDPVDSAKGCTYLIGTYFDEGHCKTNESTTFETVEDYENPMYSRFDNFSCPPEFFQDNNFCYGFLDANCSDPSDCLSTSYSCQSGTCQRVNNRTGKSILSSKPGVSAYWTEDEEIQVSRGFLISASRAYTCSSYFFRLTMFVAQRLFPRNFASCYVTNGLTNSTSSKFTKVQMLIAPSAEWAKPPYPFDRAIYGGHSGVDQPTFICRTSNSDFHQSGILLPPYYDICYYNAYTLSSNTTQFEVLVEKKFSRQHQHQSFIPQTKSHRCKSIDV